MLTNIRLKNFKAFRDTGAIEIAPLTILTGPNSSGKSAIIRAMMALRQTAESRDQTTAFVPSGDFVDLGPYEDFVFMQDVKSTVGFEIVSKAFAQSSSLFGLEMPSDKMQPELAISIELAYLTSRDRIFLTKSTVRIEQQEISVQKTTKRGNRIGRSYRTTVNLPDGSSSRLSDSSSAKFYSAPPLQMNNGTLDAIQSNRRQRTRFLATQLAKLAEESVLQELDKFHYIGPLRERPQRMYISTGETPREVGTAGELGPAVLWSTSEERHLRLEEKLTSWCTRMGLAYRVYLSAVVGGYFQVIVEDTHTKVRVNLPDVGVGTSQILPILIQGLIAPEGASLLLEQPEIHLHPKAQADLADFLIEVSRQNVGVIVETHSEHLITRVQRRVAEESLDPSNVAIYHVTPSEGGSQIIAVKMDDYGQMQSAPKGFFEEGFEETFALASAVSGRKRNPELD